MQGSAVLPSINTYIACLPITAQKMSVNLEKVINLEERELAAVVCMFCDV